MQNWDAWDFIFRYIEIHQTDFDNFHFSIAPRGHDMIGAPIAAWTGWSKSRVMAVVHSLSSKVINEAHATRIRGEGVGNASYDLPGGAKVHLSGNDEGIHVILNSADAERMMQQKE